METYGTAVVSPATLMLHGDGRNYEEWKVRMQTYLLSQDLWKDVQQTDEPFPGRVLQNYMALHVIQNSCSTQAFSVINKDIWLAREAWKTLEDEYAKPIPLDQDTHEENMSEAILIKFQRLYNAVREGKLDILLNLISDRESRDILLNKRIPDKGETALHTAVTNGHEHIVALLVSRMSLKGLKKRDSDGYTALITAAVLGKMQMVDCMLHRHGDLIGIRSGRCGENDLPVVMAINSGQIEMARHLFHRYHIDQNTTQISGIGRVKDATLLLTWAIYTKTLDIALVLIRSWRSLALMALDENGDRESPILALVSISQSFPSGMRIPSAPPTSISHTRSNVSNEEQRQRNIQEDQNNIPGGGIPASTPQPSETRLDVGPSREYQSNQENQNNMSGDMPNPSAASTSQTHLNGSDEVQWQSIDPEEYKKIRELYKMKKIHELYNELLKRMYEVISESKMQQLADGLVYTAICRAVKNGIFEFVSKILEIDRRFLWIQDRNERNIFMLAVLHRQEKIFSILHGVDGKMIYSLTSKLDVYGNNMLHMAGMIEDSSTVNQLPGEAIQMQRELQWFKAVERIVPPNAKENTNEDGLTPQKLFTKNHKNMMKKGEKWMKSTATSCSVVGTLIVTIVFAATFTLPGGNKQDTGLPFFLKSKWFIVFMIFDALSFFLSLTSVSMFLGILTSRYAKDDFLVSLPRKMIIGLFTLFCSIVTMMITFSSALLIILDEKLYIAIPLICLAGFPVTCFLWMQRPILEDMVKSTYFSSIFDGKTNIS